MVGLGNISRTIDLYTKSVDDEMTLMKKDRRFLDESEQNQATESIHKLIDKLNEFITFVNREYEPYVNHDEEDVFGGKRRRIHRRRRTTRKHKRSYKR